MTILEFFKTAHPSVLAAKMIFRHLQKNYPVQKISDIADTSSGGTPNRGMIEYYNGTIPWVKSGELKDSIITSCDEYITESGLKNSSAKLFPKGTLLVAMYGANIGKTGVLDFAATTNQAVCAIFPKVDISKDFLFWYFKQERIDFIAIGKGGAQPNISQTVINNASIVVPDKGTQNKIVAFLEQVERGEGIDQRFFIPEVLHDIERIYKYKNSYVDLTESFETQLTQLENLNQAILQEAVQGKLVKQDKKDEPASELLKRIKAEKATLRQTQGKKEKPLPPIKPEEIPFEIPDSWVWCRLGEMSINRDGERKPIAQSERNGRKKIYDYYGASGVIDKIDGFTHEGELLLIGEDGANLVARSTPIAFLAKGKFWVNNHAHVIETVDRITLDYLCYYINSIDLKPYVTGGFQPKLSQGNLNIIPVPVPPLAEQERIVSEIEKQLNKTKQLQEHILANQEATEQLLKALLHQAFEVSETGLAENEENVLALAAEPEVVYKKTKVVPLYPTQEKEENYFIKRKVLATYIINQSLDDHQFGDVKFEKLLHLSDYFAIKRNLGQKFYQKVAGPLDNAFTIPYFTQIEQSKWFNRKKVGRQFFFSAGVNHSKSLKTYDYFSDEEFKKVNKVIGYFKKYDYEQPEIISTLYAVWNNRLIKNEPISDTALIADFYEWDEAKKKYEGKRLMKAIQWMKDENFIPDGWGKLIEKPKTMKNHK